jgi:branched-chain amino acid transport system ATP-binding protein
MTLFEARNLHKSFGGLAVTDNLSLRLDAGDRVALIGPNGAGKTSFVNLVTGQLAPDSGWVHLVGSDITRLSTARRVRAGLVRSFQITRLFPELTCEEHVALARLQFLGRTGHIFADYRAMPDVVDEVAAILDLLELGTIARQPVGAIAYGQQRLLEIALTMALRPKILLLDEPAAGLAGADIGLLERALAQLPADLAILLIEHDIDFVFRFASRVVVLVAGAIIFDGTPDAAASDRRVREAYLGSYADDRGSA